MNETRAEQIMRWEQEGRLDPQCIFCCRDFYANHGCLPSEVFAPNHKASEGCESGKRPHCTCDTCFQVLLMVCSLYAYLPILWA